MLLPRLGRGAETRHESPTRGGLWEASSPSPDTRVSPPSDELAGLRGPGLDSGHAFWTLPAQSPGCESRGLGPALALGSQTVQLTRPANTLDSVCDAGVGRPLTKKVPPRTGDTAVLSARNAASSLCIKPLSLLCVAPDDASQMPRGVCTSGVSPCPRGALGSREAVCLSPATPLPPGTYLGSRAKSRGRGSPLLAWFLGS